MKDTERIKKAQKAADKAFWKEIKKHFPEIKDEGLPLSLKNYWEKEQLIVIKYWLTANN